VAGGITNRPPPDRATPADTARLAPISPATKLTRLFFPLMAVVPIAVMSVSLAVFFTLWNLENQNAKASFDIVAQERFDALGTNVALTLDSLVSLGAFYDGSPDVGRAEFARIAKDLLARDHAIQALEWIPRMPKGLRADRENSAERDGFRSFQITERGPQGQLTRAGDRDEYFPVFFVEPLKGNEKALGFDLASDPVRNEALKRAAATATLVATSRVKLVQETGDQYGFLVFRPVYRGGTQPLSVQDRRARLMGFVLAVFRVEGIVEKPGAIAKTASGLDVAVFDLDAKPGERLLYPKSARFDGPEDLPSGIRAIRQVTVASRSWVMAAYPGPRAFRPAHWNSWSALARGAILAILLTGYLRLNRRRRLEIEQSRAHLEDLVQLRTTALETKEHQLRLLLESTAEAIYGIDMAGRCTFCNPACLRLLGYERAEDLLGKNMHVQIHHSRPDSSVYPMSECRIYRAFRRGVGTHVTDEVLWRADGTSFPVEYWSHPQRRGGEVLGAVVTFVDITESKRVEEKLRLAQTSVEQASDAVSWLDSRGRIVYVNEAACRSLGCSREDLLSLSITDIVPDLSPEGWVAAWEKVKLSGSMTFETQHRTRQGQIFPVEVSATYVEFDGNEYYFRFARDITQRKQIEKELRESEAYVTALLDAMPAGVVVIDAETHRITDTNSFALNLMGRKREEVIGQTCHGYICPADTGRCPITDLHQKVDHSERVLLKADGTRVPILKSVMPLVRQGRTYLVEAFGDLTDHKRTQADLEKAKEAAVAADRAKTAFLANMSHEIRTPMNAVLGYSQLMLRDPSLSGDAKKNLNIINRSGEHLLGLIDDILVMSKIEAGRMDLKPVSFDMATLVTDLVAMFRLRAEAKGLKLEVRLDGEAERRIVADQGKIREVLINLLGNALKFTEAGWIKVRAAVAQRPDGQTGLSIQVEDTGVGISPTEQSKLFRPFVQTQSGVETQSGTGLGLAICREYVRLMGGEITVWSQANWGSIFQFEIPVREDVVSRTPSKPAPGRVLGLASGQPAARLLIVDDQSHARGWLKELLKSIGFEVREADRGEVAIRVCREWKPQLILMDMQMPGMNGMDASRAIKAESNGKPPVIVALTASATDEARDTVMNGGGVDDYLTKPCREGELLEKLRVHLKLEYRYDGEQAAEMDGPGAGASAMGDELLAKLPADLIDRLREAVLNGEKDRLDELIQRAAELDPRAAHSLQEASDRYEYDILARWFEEAAETGMGRQAERT